MTEYPYSYTVAMSVDDAVFAEYCSMLELNINNIKKDSLLIDVDGSETQVYHYNGKKIIVHNSCDVDAVFIDSQFDLLPFFDRPPIINTSKNKRI